MKRKGKGRMLLIVLAVLVFLVVITLGGGLLYTAGEHREAKNLPIAIVDFKKLRDGTYIGEYEGGMYKWRANKVQVTVSSGRVTDIKQMNSTDPGGENTDQDSLYDRVIEAQSLQVDTISGATLTSKAYLKSVEDALLKAQAE